MNTCLNSVAIVIPWYGKIPKYFPFFVDSLYGVDLDVLLFTDVNYECPHPDNLKVIKLGWGELKKMIDESLGTQTALCAPYKLCDFKPMYGKIFEKWLSPYKYWGWGDCDLVYGRQMNDLLRRIIDDDCDVVSLRKNWLSGSFCLMKNTEKLRNLFYAVATYNDVVHTKEYMRFDEIGGCWFAELDKGEMTVEDCFAKTDSFTSVVWRDKSLRFFHDDLMGEDSLKSNCVSRTGEGRLFLGVREIPAFHYIYCKGNGHFFIPKVKRVDGGYHIDDTGFQMNEFSWRFRRVMGLCRRICFWVDYKVGRVRALGLRNSVLKIYEKTKKRFGNGKCYGWSCKN